MDNKNKGSHASWFTQRRNNSLNYAVDQEEMFFFYDFDR